MCLAIVRGIFAFPKLFLKKMALLFCKMEFQFTFALRLTANKEV